MATQTEEPAMVKATKKPNPPARPWPAASEGSSYSDIPFQTQPALVVSIVVDAAWTTAAGNPLARTTARVMTESLIIDLFRYRQEDPNGTTPGWYQSMVSLISSVVKQVY